MFKRIHPHARLWIVTTIIIGLVIAFKPIAQITEVVHPNKGLLVAYYQNDYQRFAIDALIKRDNLEQYSCLYELWTRESNWRPAAVNKSSKAMGIAQLMPQTWVNIEVPLTKDGYKQVLAGLKYVDHRYGKKGVCRAYAHYLAKGWY
jgi:soluble lytic murein transglycosylase-like protein